jgi:hypothetical protein
MQYPYPELTILNDMIEIFAGGRKWTRYVQYDGAQSHCMLGAMRHSRGVRGIKGDRTARYLRSAIRNVERGFFRPSATVAGYNDECDGFEDVFWHRAGDRIRGKRRAARNAISGP